MTETRKLAAILAADVVGYSRLMGEDEVGTARAVREHRSAAAPLVASKGGRIVKTTGDGLLIEFPSVVAAVECAIGIQKLMIERNAGTPSRRPGKWPFNLAAAARKASASVLSRSSSGSGGSFFSIGATPSTRIDSTSAFSSPSLTPERRFFAAASRLLNLGFAIPGHLLRPRSPPSRPARDRRRAGRVSPRRAGAGREPRLSGARKAVTALGPRQGPAGAARRAPWRRRWSSVTWSSHPALKLEVDMYAAFSGSSSSPSAVNGLEALRLPLHARQAVNSSLAFLDVPGVVIFTGARFMRTGRHGQA